MDENRFYHRKTGKNSTEVDAGIRLANNTIPSFCAELCALKAIFRLYTDFLHHFSTR